MIHALLDFLNFDTVCNQLLQFKLYDTFIEIEMLCSRNDRFVTRENLVQSMFIQAVK